MNIYAYGKTIFANSELFCEFIDLDQNIYARDRLEDAILNQPFSIILLYGLPGVGKTFILEKIYQKLHKEHKIYYQKVPFDNFKSFIIQLCHTFFGFRPDVRSSAQELINSFAQSIEDDGLITLLIDEAQMYQEENLEYLRVLSDSKKIKLILAMHKIDREDAIAKEYFSSRIWESIELKNLNIKECSAFLERKLRTQGVEELFAKLEGGAIKSFYRCTHGNLRKLNKLAYKVFEISEYYDANRPTALKNGKISKKIVEMAAIDTGLIDA